MKITIKWMLLLSVIVRVGNAQTLSDLEKQQILQTLEFNGSVSLADGSRANDIIDALNKASRYRVTEAVPLIQQRVWSFSGTLLAVAMGVLYDLNDSNLQAMAKAVVDTAEKILSGGVRRNAYFFSDPKEVRQRAIFYLFKLGDFTYADRFVAYAQERGGIGNVTFGISMAGMMGASLPSYRDFAKNQLLAIMYADTTTNGSRRKQAALSFLTALGRNGQAGGLQQLVDFFALTDDRSGTNPAVADYISAWQYPPIVIALRSKLSLGREEWYHESYARALLANFGTPENFHYLMSYAEGQPDEIVKHYVLGLLASFVPDTPSVNSPLGVLLDSLNSYSGQCYSYQWIGDGTFFTDLGLNLQTAREKLATGDSVNCARQVKSFQQRIGSIYADTSHQGPKFVTIEGWKFLFYNAQYVLDRLPQIPASTGCAVKLINSTGTKLTGGSLQYYDGSWKEATNSNDGTFSITTSLKTLSLRMTYEFGTQTKSNVTVGYDTVAFQTVNTQVKLLNSLSTPIDTGTVQYYFSSWKTLGSTTNGVASKELLPGSYTFRMTYASATLDKQQDIVANPIVVFQTVNASVQLKNSQGSLIDQGTVQYYFSSWKNFGATTDGVVTKELLPGSYTFRMTYAAATLDKQQNIGTNATVLFQTVNASVQLKNSLGSFIDQGTVQYYFSSWNSFGNTANGVATKELLPGSYTFRMSYAAATSDKQQNIGASPTVLFQTVNATVQLRNSLGSPLDPGTVQYYFNSWNNFGPTTNGIVAKELLPGNYTFRMTYEAATNDKQQNIATNPSVVFQTVNAVVQLRSSQSAPLDTGRVQYYFSSWKDLGVTLNGMAAKELLPASYTFRMTYESVSNDKVQNISTNGTVSFSTVLCTVSVKNSQGQPVSNAIASYYSTAWKQIGPTVNGQITKELLPANLTFRMTSGTASQDKVQNLGTNGLVEFLVQ